MKGVAECEPEANCPVDQGSNAHVQPILDKDVDSVFWPEILKQCINFLHHRLNFALNMNTHSCKHGCRCGGLSASNDSADRLDVYETRGLFVDQESSRCIIHRCNIHFCRGGFGGFPNISITHILHTESCNIQQPKRWEGHFRGPEGGKWLWCMPDILDYWRCILLIQAAGEWVSSLSNHNSNQLSCENLSGYMLIFIVNMGLKM